MIKNKELLIALTREIICKMDLIGEFGKNNEIISNGIRSGLDIMCVVESELEKE